MMEVYAAATAQSDYEIGRVIDALQESGQLDNTLVIYIEGDNGASAEGTMQGTTNEVSGQFAPESIEFLVSMIDELGSDRTYNHYPIGWAHAMDAPFQWTKQVASHFGGTRNGLAVMWPKRIKAHGEIRSQFHHVIDIVPTVLEAAGVEAPILLNGTQQKPLEGVSMVYTLRRRERADATHDPILRDDRQPRDLSRWLDRKHNACAVALGDHRRRAGPG